MINNDLKITEIVEKIVAAVQPTRIYLFGSRVRGDAHEDSDYDITIIYDGELSKRDIQLRIRKVLRGLRLALDLFVLTSYEFERYKDVATTLERELNENGTVIYG